MIKKDTIRIFRLVIALSLPVLLISCSGDNADKSRPNILLAIADDASYPHFGAYGTEWIKTPAIDAIAEEGILFTNVYTPNAKCSPSRACLLTGRNSWQLEEVCNHWAFWPSEYSTFMEVLGENGYHTGYTTKGFSPGIPGLLNGKPRQLTGKPYNEYKLEPPAQGISNSDYAKNFRAFLEDKPQDQPFCFWYGSIEPHRRYEYGVGERLGGYNPDEIDDLFPEWPDTSIVKTDLLDYAFEINYFDKHLGRMIQMLEKSGEIDNTLVIVTADNGMPFPKAKGQGYEMSNHMPMVMMWGDEIKKKGVSNNSMISFIDIAPTLLEIAGIDQAKSGMKPIQGKSISRIFRDPSIEKKSDDYILIGKERHDVGRPDDQAYPVRGIIKNDYLYLMNFKPDRWPAGDPVTGYLNCDASPTKSLILELRRQGRNKQYWDLSFGLRPNEELYNIKDDPHCIDNLASEISYNDTKESLRKFLLNELEAQGDPRVLGHGDVFDNYVYADKRTRDFYNRFMSGEFDSTSAGWVNPSDFEIEKIK